METNVVSHSMAEGFTKCRKQFEIQHVKQLMPKKTPSGIRKGNSGHAFFEGFLTTIKNGGTPKQGQAKGMANLMTYKDATPELIPFLMNWVENEWPKYARRWQILEIEKTYHLKIRTEKGLLYFPFTVDLLVKDLVTGKILLIDHKCLGREYNENAMETLPQQAKYMGALRALGVPVDEAYYNIVKTAKIAGQYVNLFVKIPITDQRIKTAMQEQIQIMQEIGNSPNYYRTANSMNCSFCSVAELCIAEQNDTDVEAITDLHFTKNDYGYTAEELENGTAGRKL